MTWIVFPALAFVVPAGVAAYHLYFSQRLPWSHLTESFYVIHKWYANALKTRDFPLWNPHINGGIYQLSEPGTAPWSPFATPWFYFLNPAAAMLALIFTLYSLGSAGVYRLTRSHSHHRGVSLCAAIAYGLGNAVLMSSVSIPHLISAALLPWGIYFFHRFNSTRRPVYRALIALVLGTLIWHGQGTAAVLLFLWAVTFCIFNFDRFDPRTLALPFGLIMIFGVSLGLGAISLVPIWSEAGIAEFTAVLPALYPLKPGQFISAAGISPWFTLFGVAGLFWHRKKRRDWFWLGFFILILVALFKPNADLQAAVWRRSFGLVDLFDQKVWRLGLAILLVTSGSRLISSGLAKWRSDISLVVPRNRLIWNSIWIFAAAILAFEGHLGFHRSPKILIAELQAPIAATSLNPLKRILNHGGQPAGLSRHVLYPPWGMETGHSHILAKSNFTTLNYRLLGPDQLFEALPVWSRLLNLGTVISPAEWSDEFFDEAVRRGDLTRADVISDTAGFWNIDTNFPDWEYTRVITFPNSEADTIMLLKKRGSERQPVYLERYFAFKNHRRLLTTDGIWGELTPQFASAEALANQTPVSITRREKAHDRESIEVISAAPAFLIFRENMHPGWTVRLNGREFPIIRADLFSRAVFIKTGKQTLEFEFDPPSFRQGLMISLIAGVIVALWLLLNLRRPA